MGLGNFIKKTAGYACMGAAYQSGKKAIKSDSIIGSAFYSTLTGVFGNGAHCCLKNTPEYNVALEGLDKILDEVKNKKESEKNES